MKLLLEVNSSFHLKRKKQSCFCSGDGVFAGYRNQDELTRKVLIEHDGYLCYRTGDVGRLNINNGQIEYLGRRDHQIKIRGQRIELDEIENTIMRYSPQISNCLVVKVTDASIDRLVAYIENNSLNENDIRKYCTSNLSPFMVPSFFMIIDKFPLNQSGKIDRLRLPLPNVNIISEEEHLPSSVMEHQLCSMITKAFEISQESLKNVNATFNQLGATSLGIVKLLELIRQENLSGSYPVDISILLDNPSIRQVAQTLELFRSSDQPELNATINDQYKTVQRSFIIETVGIIGLIYIFALPIYFALRTSLILAPLLHLFVYILFKNFLPLPTTNEWHLIYSSSYYRWWFLQRLWKLNTLWHQMLIGTSLYNIYLRLCGAKIGVHVQLRTSVIDCPDLIDIGEDSFVGEEVVFNSMEYRNDNMFRLNSIQIGEHCSIGARSVLHSRVNIDNHVIVKPLTYIGK